MEAIAIRVNDPAYFDRMLDACRANGVAEVEGTLELICKPGATERGNPGVMITFVAHIRDDGYAHQVQAVCTLANLYAAVSAIAKAHNL